MATVEASGPGLHASRWAWAAVVASVVSALGYALQTILDYVAAPATFKFGVFWGPFAGAAVLSFLTGVVAIVKGWRWGRRNPTLALGLVGVGWLLLAQGIQLVWN